MANCKKKFDWNKDNLDDIAGRHIRYNGDMFEFQIIKNRVIQQLDGLKKLNKTHKQLKIELEKTQDFVDLENKEEKMFTKIARKEAPNMVRKLTYEPYKYEKC